jgi:diguanylate cyclase (GGDEF)-like protein
VIDIFLIAILLNILYYFVILKFPFFFYKQRIIYIAMMDVISSAYIAYIVGAYSAYYPALFLWYSIGYGVRFGSSVSLPVYVVTIISWLLVITNNTFWIENISFGIGWLLAFIVIPLYHFYLLRKLKRTLAQLHQSLDFSEYQSHHDELTNLPNRLSFEKELNHSILTREKFALFFIDLDGFKRINDTFGHQVGDQVLVETAKRLMSLNNFAARLGGDEFVVLVDFQDKNDLREYAENLIKLLAKKCKNPSIKITTSVGIAIYPDDTKNIHELKRKSDIAMYEAKENGKNTFRFYSSTFPT